jgi:hypothetical protein
VRGGILPTGFVVSFCGAADLQGRVGGGGEARPRPGARDIAKNEEGGERIERDDGKAAGDYGFITLQRGSAWQMEDAPTPYQTRRAVRAVRAVTGDGSHNSQVYF